MSSRAWRKLRLLPWLMAIAAGVCGASTVRGHALTPALLEIRETALGHREILWKRPLLWLGNGKVEPLVPAHCRELGPTRVENDLTSWISRSTLECGQVTLAGQRIGVSGLSGTRSEVLYRVELADGRLLRGVLDARQSSVLLPERQSWGSVARSYLDLGVEHILLGLDHLVFVLGLLLLVRGRRLLIQTITCFTLGHCVTLSVAALGYLAVPPALVEIGIAVSILVLAVEITRPGPAPREAANQHPPGSPGRTTLLRRFPWAMAFFFGLLHGMGFAGALAEVGLPQAEIPLALLSFNLGIEVGQLVFVALILALLRFSRRWASRLPVWSSQIPAHAIGALAVFWCFDRAATLL